MHQYEVKYGDSICSVSQKFSVPEASLMRINRLGAGSALETGQVLKVPVCILRHRVKKGESINSIAESYQLPASALSYEYDGNLTALFI